MATAGPRNRTGPEGRQGPEGPQGQVGPQGERGPRGLEGPEGPEGPRGLMGYGGPPGPVGPQGPAGPSGGSVNETCEAIDLTTTDTSETECWTKAVALGKALRIRFEILARADDGSLERALFERAGLFYNEGGVLKAEGFWHTLVTRKSNSAFEVGYDLSGDEISLWVQSPINENVLWKGKVCFTEL